MVVALVAIMKAGGGYFPIDPGYPPARKQFMLDDVAAARWWWPRPKRWTACRKFLESP